MLDTMRFEPNRIDVKQGETIRFVHKNDGKLMHEFIIGTKEELREHAALMEKFPNMEHDEPLHGTRCIRYDRPDDLDFQPGR